MNLQKWPNWQTIAQSGHSAPVLQPWQQRLDMPDKLARGRFIEQMFMLSLSFRCDQIYKCKRNYFGRTLLCYLSPIKMVNKPNSGSNTFSLSVSLSLTKQYINNICIYIYMYVCMYVCIYIYMCMFVCIQCMYVYGIVLVHLRTGFLACKMDIMFGYNGATTSML
jgi:hypothetical protein